MAGAVSAVELPPSAAASMAARVSRGIRWRVARGAEWLWWHSPRGRRAHQGLAALRNRYAGRRCWVFGSGPSLLKTDPRRLRDEVTIGSNALFLVFPQMGYSPTFLTVEDRLVAEDRAPELNALRGTTKVFPRDLAYVLEEDGDTLYCNFVRNYRGFPTFSSKFEDVVYWGGTVSFLNLQLAYHLGCDPIYLIGFDHSYRVPAQMDGAVITSQGDDVNHVHPDYFGKGYRWHDPKVERMELAYGEARRFLDQRGVRVFNATAGGHLEVFERASYESAVGDRA